MGTMLSLPCTRGAAILAAALLAFTATACDGATKPEAREGSIDLTGVDFLKSSPVSLRGEWTAVLPDGREGSLAVPGNWKGQSVGGSALGGFGSLTYRLEVRLGENPGNLSLRLGEIGTASVVYLNGRVVAENGRVGGKADSMPAVGIRYVGIPEGADRLKVEILVSNFDDPNGGGIWGAPQLGASETVERLRSQSLVRESALAGIFMVVALYYLAMFLYRRSDLASLLFALICAAFLLRQVSTGEKLLLILFPALPWRALARMEYFSLYVLAPSYFAFFLTLFPNILPRRIAAAFLAVSAAASVFPLVLPVPAFIATLHACQLMWLLEFAALYWLLASAWSRRMREAPAFLASVSLIVFAAVNDLLLTRLYIPTLSLVTLAQGAFIFLQTLVLSRRMADEYRKSKNLEELNVHLKELDDAKTRFFTASSHELRTPVTLIATPLEEIMAGRYGDWVPKDAPVFSLLKRNADRLRRLADELLDFLRFDSGSVKIAPKAVDLSRFASGYAALFSPEASARGIRLETTLPDGITALVDPVLLETVALNLLSNALKHAERGGCIRIETGREVFRDGEGVFLSVFNSGPAVPPSQLPRLFERFNAAQVAKSADYAGIGIGLPLSAEIVRSLGGTLRAENLPDNPDAPGTGGPRFTASFPVHLGACEEFSPPSRERAKEWIRPSQAVQEGHKTRVLVVDDNRDMLDFLSDSLSNDFAVRCEESAERALAALEAGYRPHVIVSDVMMGGMDGFRFRELAAALEDCSAIPFVFLSALADRETKESALTGGAVDYILKPFSVAELAAKIASLAALGNAGRETLEKRVLRALRNENPAERAPNWRERSAALGMTERDEEVLSLLIAGLPDKAIAAELGSSPKTVSNRISSLLKKTGTQSRTELAAFMTRSEG